MKLFNDVIAKRMDDAETKLKPVFIRFHFCDRFRNKCDWLGKQIFLNNHYSRLGCRDVCSCL